MGPAPRERAIAAIGVSVGAVLVLMKVAPGIPGHFTGYEWLALVVWCFLGVALHRRERVPNQRFETREGTEVK
jgi:hypothetical protein